MKTYSYNQSVKNSGIVTNLPTSEISWSAGRNVSFRVGAVSSIFGKALLASVTNNLPIREMFTFKGTDNVFRTIVCCDTKIYAYNNNFGTVQDITPASPPSSGSTDSWQFGLIGGMPVLSNGVNPMWKWNDFNSILSPLANAPTICRAMHCHDGRVFVGDIQEGGYDYPAKTRWSGIIKPELWTKDLKGSSGGKDMINPETSMDAIDRERAITSKDGKLVIFTERNIWTGVKTEWPEDYIWAPLNQNVGLIARRTFTHSPNGLYFAGQEDFYILGNEGLKPIGFPIRNSCFPNINKAVVNTSFSFYKPSTREVVFCLPLGTATTPDTGFVYQEETASWSIIDVDFLCHSFFYDSSNTTWDTLPFGSWDTITDSSWDTMSKTGVLPSEVVGNSTGKILQLDSGYNNNGSAIESFIETGDMSFDNTLSKKTVYMVMPSCKPQDLQSALMVQVGIRDNLHQDITWSPPSPFTIGVSNLVRIGRGLRGKYVRIRFFTNIKDTHWVLESFVISYSLGTVRIGNG